MTAQASLFALSAAWRETAESINPGPFDDGANQAEIETLRECARQLEALLAVREPPPAPGRAELEAVVRDAVMASREHFDDLPCPVCEPRIAAVLAAVDAYAGSQASPELAAAMADRDDYAARLAAADQSWSRLAAERDQLREQLAVVMTENRLRCERIEALAGELKASAASTHPSRKSETESGIARKLQAILEDL